jgi:hypothetical protein
MLSYGRTAQRAQPARSPRHGAEPPVPAREAPPAVPRASDPLSATLARAVAQRSGAPLPARACETMERGFGVDLSDVRVREDAEPGRVGAMAFAEGSDLRFAPGRFDPASDGGLFLLAHELTHVLQQRAGRVRGGASCGARPWQDPALEREATRTAQRVAGGEVVRVPGAPHRAGAAGATPVRQGYLVYDPAVGHGSVTHYATNSTFEAQQKQHGSFMTALGGPRIVAGAAGAQTPVRISQNAHLAVEDADLTNRQPKYFFATPAAITGFNARLMRGGSRYQLVPDPSQTIQFDWNGAARQLVRVDLRNLANDTTVLNLLTAQSCDQTAKEVLGSVSLVPSLGRPQTTPTPDNPLYEMLLDYYVADELAGTHHAANIDLLNAQGAMPTHTENIAVAYGTAMHAHLNGVHNAVLDTAAQQMGVNEYADPDVGEGLVTHRLGEVVGGAVQDPYHARVENAPGNATLWAFHWGGVVAKDGSDYVTLENYARNAEDNLGAMGADPRFYVQMYGGGGQSWHTQWATFHPGGRNFANPLTMKVVGSNQAPAHVVETYHRTRAGWYFDGATVADQHVAVAAVANADQLAIFLYKALAYAEDVTVGDRDPTGHSRVNLWLRAILGAAIAPLPADVTALKSHVVERLRATAAGKFDLDAQTQYAATLAAVKDDYGMVATAGNVVAKADHVRKGLAYANDHITHNTKGDKARVRGWRAAVKRDGFDETARLRHHTADRLAQMRGG